MKILNSALALFSLMSQSLSSNSSHIKVGQFFNKTDGKCHNFVNMSSATTLGEEAKSYIESLRSLKLKAVIKIDKEDFKQSEKEGNCFNFATSTTAELFSPERTPGGIKLGNNFDCKIVHNAMLKNPSMRAEERSKSCGNNEREIFLFVGESESGKSDFHFIATDENGTYRHKQGRLPASIAPSKFIEDGVISEKPTAVLLSTKESDETELILPIGNTIQYELCPEKYCYDLPKTDKRDEL